jgi:uncharacterized protein with NRDE domain
MCVLTYIPRKNGLFIITHNRDEHILRPKAIPPKAQLLENEIVTYPIDPQGGGTWFAEHLDFVCCILNGAFHKHESLPPYRSSRGTIIFEFFKYKSVDVFLQKFDPKGLEPFTFVVFDLKNKQIYQLVWDEQIFHCHHIDGTKPQIWSSSTLYNEEIKSTRKKIFNQFATIEPTAQQVIDFHKINVDNDLRKSFFVNIDDQIKTVAITQVSGKYGRKTLEYLPFYERSKALLYS